MADGRFTESQALLSRALELVPLGTQTFSKARYAFPGGGAPHFTDVNLKGTFWCIQAFAGMRRKRGGPGCIVNIGDLNGLTSYVTGQILAVDGGMTAW